MSYESNEKLMLGRLYMRMHAVYFSRAMLGLIPVACHEVPTLGVTPGMVLYYNPSYLEKLTEEEMGTVLWHEVNHVIRRSHDRNGEVEEYDELRNVADDLAINSTARLHNAWRLPKGVLLPATYRFPEDLTSEEYYALLMQRGAPPVGGVCAGSCGGKNDELEKALDQQFGRSQGNVEAIRVGVAKDIRESAPGSVPQHLRDWAKNYLNKPSVIPWEREFRHVLRSATLSAQQGDDDVSRSRPSKRSYALPAYVPLRPGPIGSELELAFILDTSGSMSMENDIKPCLREVHAALLAAGCDRAWLIQADAGVAHVERIAAKDLLNIEIHGRGGTDFRPPIDHLSKLRPYPNVTVYNTDGEGPAPETPPRNMKFIWAVCRRKEAPAPWGRAVFIR